MKSSLTAAFIIVCLAGLPSPAIAQTAAPFDRAAAKKTLAVKMRNPLRSAAPVVKRNYERNPDKGLELELVERSDGTKEERPYVAVPLFRVGTAELLDEVSRDNVRQLSLVLRELLEADAGASFSIQGHTRAKGIVATNPKLSEARAAAIFGALVKEALRRVGFGTQWAVAPAHAPEARLQQDRRVMVVRNEFPGLFLLLIILISAN